MVSASTVLEPYTERKPLVVVLLTAGLLFVEGVLISYQWFLKNANASGMGLSTIETAVYVFGSFLVEPILLFGVVYYVGSRFDRRIPLVKLLPGLAGAVVVGSVLGQLVGGTIWFPPLHLTNVGIRVDPVTLLNWRDTLGPLVRDLLTVVAALGLASSRHPGQDQTDS